MMPHYPESLVKDVPSDWFPITKLIVLSTKTLVYENHFELKFEKLHTISLFSTVYWPELYPFNALEV